MSKKRVKKGPKWVKYWDQNAHAKNRRMDTGQPYSPLTQCHFKEKGLPASHVPQHNVLPEQPFLWKRFKDIILDFGFLHLLLFLCASFLLIIIVLWHCCATPLIGFYFCLLLLLLLCKCAPPDNYCYCCYDAPPSALKTYSWLHWLLHPLP